MATRNYVWRTAPTGTEGTATVYVDSYTGSDLLGNGTRGNPYRTLTKAWNANDTKPTRIICRGCFSENISTGNISRYIHGDFLGAAVFDGLNIYMIYNFAINNMIFKNCPSNIVGAENAGLGICENNTPWGIGSSNIFINCYFIKGILGSDTGPYGNFEKTNRNVFAKPISNDIYKIAIGHNHTYLGSMYYNTYYCCRISDRKKLSRHKHSFELFVDFDMIANEGAQVCYNYCLFAADCKWYYLTGNNTSSAYYELTVSGSTSEERKDSLLAALEAKYTELGVAAGSRVYPTFTGCIFSTQTAAQIFNDAANDDYTLIPGCDADHYVSAEVQYIGALPPALNIPIIGDLSDNTVKSDGQAGTWDEHTVAGCVVVDDNKICIDTDSDSKVGSILSKVIAINPVTTQLNAIYATFNSKFMQYGAYANKDNIFEKNQQHEVVKVGPGVELEPGRYMMTHLCLYNDESIDAGQILVVTASGTTFTSDNADCRALSILEPNVMEVVYCRCRSQIYLKLKQADTLAEGGGLQSGATYLNISGGNITYNGRTVANGESFVGTPNNTTFTAANPDAQVAVMFDDSRVPVMEWCPAQLFGEYFVAKQNGSIVTDLVTGLPKSSGNYNSYPTTGLQLSTMDRRYIQFKVEVNRI